jgi:hypothetical protein
VSDGHVHIGPAPLASGVSGAPFSFHGADRGHPLE